MHQNRGINRTFVPIIVRVGLTLPVFPSVYYQHRIIRRTTPGQNRYAMTFQELNLIEPLKRAVAEKGYTTPTPIQQQAIPPALEGRDLLGCAQTGTGKTAAFPLPIPQLLSAEPRTKGRRTIKTRVLTPTRELAIQIDECCRDYARYTDIRHCVIFGGVNQRPQVDALQRGIDLLVATPGRLLDLIGQGYVSLSDIRFFVLDEADRMLDMGFIHDIRRILPLLPAKRQTLFFSATMPDDIVKLANTMLRNPAHVTVTPRPRWSRPSARASCSPKRPKNGRCWPPCCANAPRARCWYFRAPSTAPTASPVSSPKRASKDAPSTETSRRAPANGP